MYSRVNSTYDGNKINISTQHRVSILRANSGIGKTYIAEALQDVLRLGQYNGV